jgi:hypothetical protein
MIDHPLTIIIQLLLLVSPCPKVITLSGVHCSVQFINQQKQK